MRDILKSLGGIELLSYMIDAKKFTTRIQNYKSYTKLTYINTEGKEMVLGVLAINGGYNDGGYVLPAIRITARRPILSLDWIKYRELRDDFMSYWCSDEQLIQAVENIIDMRISP